MIRALPLFALLLFAQPVSAQEWVARRVGEIQALDKVNARVVTLRATVGEPTRFGTLTITLRACHARPADEVSDAAAWLEVRDDRSPAGSGPVFRGWLFADAPAVHMFEHPVYDLRIMNCRSLAGPASKIIVRIAGHAFGPLPSDYA